MPPKGKKKKNPLNDFYFFMQDMKKVLRREGQDWETMEDLVALCHPRWRLLPEHDKARYKQRAKDHKEQERLDLQSRFDSQGRTLLQVEMKRKVEICKFRKCSTESKILSVMPMKWED